MNSITMGVLLFDIELLLFNIILIANMQIYNPLLRESFYFYLTT